MGFYPHDYSKQFNTSNRHATPHTAHTKVSRRCRANVPKSTYIHTHAATRVALKILKYNIESVTTHKTNPVGNITYRRNIIHIDRRTTSSSRSVRRLIKPLGCFIIMNTIPGPCRNWWDVCVCLQHSAWTSPSYGFHYFSKYYFYSFSGMLKPILQLGWNQNLLAEHLVVPGEKTKTPPLPIHYVLIEFTIQVNH